MASGISPKMIDSFCQRCGKHVDPLANFCQSCGTSTTDSPVSTPKGQPVVVTSVEGQGEFERTLRIAWSCLKEVEHKTDAIRKAKEATDTEINEGTFRGMLERMAIQGGHEAEFNESLTIAWNSAVKAWQINATGMIEIKDVNVTPQSVCAGVCCLRGDLNFALERWDEAIALYKQSLQYNSGLLDSYYNIGAAYTNKHEPNAAIEAFQKVVAMDPVGHYGIEAAKNIEKLKLGRLGAKSFTGSWKVVGVLAIPALLSFFMMNVAPSVGFQGLVFWGGVLAFYWWWKFK